MRAKTALGMALALCAAAAFGPAPQAQAADVRIVYLEQQVERPPVLSNLDPFPEDDGLAGARLALADNASTAKFLGHNYSMREIVVAPGEDFDAAARAALTEGAGLIVAVAPAEQLLRLADMPEARDALVINAGAPDDILRGEACRANMLHASPSRAMLSDGLAQFLIKRQWDRWFLIEGEGPGDAEFAAAMRRSAAKFGGKIVAEAVWRFDADMRRDAFAEAPVFTQGPQYDVILVADEIEDWARYLPFNTWLPRPVAGSEGLRAVAWSDVVEAWGAAQLQNRFEALAGRGMRSTDYAAWAAVRSIGEAVTRTNAADAQTLRAFMLSDAFQLAGFKGLAMNYRSWNGQLRQPIPLVHPRALVTSAPIEGFLHERTGLDTLGTDEPETTCAAFR
ncbi:MAG: ABC transporter substrate-binding protein [Rubrimonas sp.]